MGNRRLAALLVLVVGLVVAGPALLAASVSALAGDPVSLSGPTSADAVAARAEPGTGIVPTADDADPTVYVTKTGKKYHRAGCQYLRKSSIPIKLSVARQSYGACSVCKPPQ